MKTILGRSAGWAETGETAAVAPTSIHRHKSRTGAEIRMRECKCRADERVNIGGFIVVNGMSKMFVMSPLDGTNAEGRRRRVTADEANTEERRRIAAGQPGRLCIAYRS